VSRIPVDLITKSGPKTESYYEYLISRYIAPYFTLLFKKLQIKNPNIITWCSFSLILIASVMVVNLGLLSSIVYRVIIAVLIQLNFIWDCSDGQLARITGTTSKLGAWLDKILDRVGEFIIFSVFGYVAWQYTGNLIFLLLGIITGYSLSAFTLAMALSNSSKLQNLTAIKKITSNKNSSNKKRKVKKNINEIKMVNVITKVFFFLA
jgi:phosphatidylglycerophosphate synthase